VGSKGTQQKQTVDTYQAAQPVADVSQDVLRRTQELAKMGYTVPTQQIADLNRLQYQAIGSIADYYNLAQRPYQQAQAMAAGAGAPISGADVSNYLNPYAQYALAGLQDVQGAENVKRAGALTRAAGGIGADRAAVAMAEKYRQDQLARGQLMSSFYQPAMAAAQADKARQLSAAGALGGLGAGAQTAGISGAQALFGAGAAPQSIEQQRLNAAYSAALANIEAPWKMAQIESGIAAQQAPVLGGTKTSTTTMPAPSPWGTIAGLGLTAAGLFTGNPMMAGAGMMGMGGGGGDGFIPGSTPEWSGDGTRYIGTRNPYVATGGRINEYAKGGAVSEEPEADHFYDGGVPSMGGGSFVPEYGGDSEGFGALSPYAGLLSTGQTPDIPEDASWAYPSSRVEERFPMAGENLVSNPYDLRTGLAKAAERMRAEMPEPVLAPKAVATQRILPPDTASPADIINRDPGLKRAMGVTEPSLPPSALALARIVPNITVGAPPPAGSTAPAATRVDDTVADTGGYTPRSPYAMGASRDYKLSDFLPQRRDSGIGRRLLEAGLTMLAASGERDKFGFPISPWAAAGRGGMAALAGQAEEEKARALQEQKALDLMEKARTHRETQQDRAERLAETMRSHKSAEEERKLRREELGQYRERKEAGIQSRFEARQDAIERRSNAALELRKAIADSSGNYRIVNYIPEGETESRLGVVHSKSNVLRDSETNEPVKNGRIIGVGDPSVAERQIANQARLSAVNDIKQYTDLGRTPPPFIEVLNQYREKFGLPKLNEGAAGTAPPQRPSGVPADALFSNSTKQYWSADNQNAWDATGKQIVKDGVQVQ